MKKDRVIRHFGLWGSTALLFTVIIFLLICCTGCVQSKAQNIEERLKKLEAANETLQKKLERVDAVQEIQNLMGRYVWMHEVQKDPEFIDTMFAENNPDVSWEVAHMGLYRGREAVKEILNQHGPKGGSIAPGTLFIHTLTTPVIEIAEDGQTAKGVWKSPGAETITDPKTGKLRGMWAWTKYACDFIKEDGKWKILHYHVYRIFMTPADVNYTDEYESKFMSKAMAVSSSGGGAGQGSSHKEPTTYDNPFTTKYVPELVPAPPEPYRTFSETFTYGKPATQDKGKN
jgi:hypothetical protein